MLTLRVKECYRLTMNFILKHNDNSEPDLKKMTAALEANGVSVLDGRLLPKTALIALEESDLKSFLFDLGSAWKVLPEHHYGLPGSTDT